MKNVKFLHIAVLLFWGLAAMAQDLSGPQYAMWGETVEERTANMLNSSFFKEEANNRNYDAASGYLKLVLDAVPGAAESTYQIGVNVFKNKYNATRDPEMRQMYVDSMMLLYDMRVQYFPNTPRYGTAFVLDQKARDYLRYKPTDRAGIRQMFRNAIEAGGDKTNPETMVVYFANLAEDFKKNELTTEELVAEYERLAPVLDKNPNAGDAKKQLDAAFGLSGAASCENLEKLYTEKIAANPDDEALLAQAVRMMVSAKCETPFFFATAERWYTVKPSSETALFLAAGFQNKGDFTKAMQYLDEAMSVEQDPAERQKLLVRMALLNFASNNINAAATHARQARDLNPADGSPYYILASCYGASAVACGGFAGQTAFWAAYDTMARALELLPADSEYIAPARSALSAYRSNFPNSEEIFFNELQEGSRFKVNCGTASGVVTTVRPR